MGDMYIRFTLIQFDFNFLKANCIKADWKLHYEVPELSALFVPIPKSGWVSLWWYTPISITVKRKIM